MFLQGYGPLILSGTWQTVKLAVLSLVFAFVIGLLGAAAKLSRNRVSSGVGTIYTRDRDFRRFDGIVAEDPFAEHPG